MMPPTEGIGVNRAALYCLNLECLAGFFSFSSGANTPTCTTQRGPLHTGQELRGFPANTQPALARPTQGQARKPGGARAGRASKNVSLQSHPNRTPEQPCHPSPSEAKLTYVPLSVHIRSLLTQKHCRTQYDAPTEKRASSPLQLYDSCKQSLERRTISSPFLGMTASDFSEGRGWEKEGFYICEAAVWGLEKHVLCKFLLLCSVK